jgi:small-conductance mechanosensitive channel
VISLADTSAAARKVSEPARFWRVLTNADLSWERVALAAVALVFGWFLARLAAVALRNAARRNLIDQGASYALGRLVRYFFFSVAAMIAMTILGIDLGSMVILGGALGVGIGFGLQNVVGNFFSGLVILFERPIRVGDRVSLGDSSSDTLGQVNGFVRGIGLRATTVETLDNIMLIVPNSEFTTRTIVNWTLGEPRVRVRLAVSVGYGSDLKRVREVMERVARANTKVLPTPAPSAGMTATADSACEFQVFCWIADPRDYGPVQVELREAIVEAFRAEGIEIPFPQRVVHLQDGRTDA